GSITQNSSVTTFFAYTSPNQLVEEARFMLLARTWWMFLIRGVLALIFGVVAILSPATAFISLVLIFGAFAFVDGVFALIAGITAKSENWLWLILEGVIGLFIGV